MARKLAARDPGKYDSRIHGGYEGGGGPPGNYMLNPEVQGVNLVFPSWKEGPLVYRPFPHMDFKEPQNRFQPGRLSPEPKSYSQWLVKVRAVVFTGLPDCDKVSFLLYEPGSDDDVKRTNPYLVFYKACVQAEKTARFGNGKKWDADWNKLLKGKKGEGAPIKEDTSVYFSQGAVFCSGQRDYMENRTTPYGLDAKDRLPVMQLGLSAGIGLTGLFDKEKKEFEGDAESDFSAPFVFGDPVGKFLAKKQIVKGGHFIKIFNPAVTKIKPADNNSWDGPAKEGEKAKIGYCAEILEEYEHNGETYKPSLDSDAVKQIFEKSQFWFDSPNGKEKGLLRFASPEEQMAWIAKAFKGTPRLVTWAFSEHEELITDEVKGILAARASTVIPGKGGDDDEDEDGDEDEGTKKKVKKTDPTVSKKKVKDEDDEEEETKSKKTTKKPSKKDEEEEEDDDEDDEEEDDEEEEEEEDDEDDEEEEDDEDDEEDDEDEEDEKPSKKTTKKPSKKDEEEEDDDDDDEESEDEDGEDDDDEDDEDDDEEGDDDDDEDTDDEDAEADEDAKPVKKGKKPEAKAEKNKDTTKPAKKVVKEEKSKPKAAKKKADEDEDADLYEDDDDKGTKKSLKAADKAKDRSEKRKTPDKPAPKPPASKGGTAKKK